MPPRLALLLTVAAIVAGVWIVYAIVRAIRRNDRTRDERLHLQQKSFEQRWRGFGDDLRAVPDRTEVSGRAPLGAAPSVRPLKPMVWSFDKEREERLERERAASRPELDGEEITRILGIGPGPDVGRAWRHLLEYRLRHDSPGEEATTAELLRWWKDQPE